MWLRWLRFFRFLYEFSMLEGISVVWFKVLGSYSVRVWV